MWVLITGRLRGWLLLLVVLPLARALVRRLRVALVNHGGETRLTRSLGRIEPLLGRRSRPGRRR